MVSKTQAAKEPKVVWVDSWEKLPNAEHPGTRAMYIGDEDAIYAIKGKTTDIDIEHEKYHRQQKGKRISDKAKPWDRLEDMIAEEIEAEKYAYDKLGKPKRILKWLRGLHDNLALFDWAEPTAEERKQGTIVVDVKPSQSMALIRKYLLRVKPPAGWLADFRTLERDYHQEYEANRYDPKSKYYGDIKYDSGQAQDAFLKRRRQNRDWWDDNFYRNSASIKKGQSTKPLHLNSLLPPDLGCKI